ncbi:MAG TPA: hypothetical protein VGO47_06570 [Chlamydiales bacterium]|nr:hypothetical protein [Chlamydiales bacterium]
MECDDFSTRAADVGVDIEGLPEMVNGRGPGHGADVEQDADVGLEDLSESDAAFLGAFDFHGGRDGHCTQTVVRKLKIEKEWNG